MSKTNAHRGWRVVALVGSASLAAAYAVTVALMARRLREPAVAERNATAIGSALPKGFLLGAATSAHQIEGGNEGNDWSAFERQPGRIARGDRSDRADDHWNRVAQDIELLERIGANAYRFSIEWSRLEPRRGTWDDEAWAHYDRELALLREAQIVPMVTLLHFTLPSWIAESGGLESADFAGAFGRFAGEASARLGSKVDLWCTINEPNVQMYNGYVVGIWPPGQRSPPAAARAFASLLRAHGAAARAIRSRNPKAAIGIAASVIDFQPKYEWSLLDLVATAIADGVYNWGFTDAIRDQRIRFRAPGFPEVDEPAPELAGTLDFVGLNYYRREIVHFSPGAPGMVKNSPGPGPKNDLGWEIHPPGLARLLVQAARRYELPLYVTENGLADAAGDKRRAFLMSHVAAVVDALSRGADVRGYFHWSLLDNFEWADGFTPRFGLYRVDYSTQSRTPTPAADAFLGLARAMRGR